MLFSVKNSNKSFFIFFIFFTFYFILYSIFIPTFENPDELLHFQHALETNSLIVNKFGDGNLYYYLINKIYNFFNQLFILHSSIEFQSNQEFQYFNDDYRFSHFDIIVDKSLLLMRLSNLILIYIFFIIYIFFFKTRIYNILFFSLLLFPGILSFFTAINPDNLNIIVAFLISLLLIKKQHILAFCIMCISFPFLDRSIITFIGSLLFYLMIYSLKKRIIILLIYIFTIALLFSSLVYIKEFLYGIYTNYEPIKSIFTLVVSYYGLLGSMSIKASYLEYFIFFICLYFYLKNVIFNSKTNKLKHFIIIYFIIWNFILVMGPSLDQGRFFYPLHFIFIYTIISAYTNIIIKKYNYILFIILVVSFIVNIKFIIKIILLGEII